MFRLVLLIVIIAVFSCNSTLPEDEATKLAKESYDIFSQQFDSLQVTAFDTIDCDELIYGLAVDLVDNPTAIHLATGEIQNIIPQELLIDALFDSTEHHYALGRFPFSKKYEGFLIGAYTHPHRHSTHLYLYDKRRWGFTHTLSLNFTMGGGAYISKRLAWICDINQDSIMDVVFRMEESLSNDNPDESFFKSTVHAEIWNGLQFVDYQAQDFAVQEWDSLFMAREFF